MVSAKFYSKN